MTVGNGMARLGVSLLVVAAAAVPVAFLIDGFEEVIRSSAAFAICSAIAFASFGLGVWSLGKSQVTQLAVTLGAFMPRMLLSLGLGGLLYWLAPVCGTVSFWIWLVVAYTLSLLIETNLLLKVMRSRRSVSLAAST